MVLLFFKLLFPIFVLCCLIIYIAILTQFNTKIILIGLLLIPITLLGMGFVNFLNSKTTVEKHDLIGQYVIDRTKYSGKEADWQYNTYRFEIFPDHTIQFYVTNGNKIIKTYKGRYSIVQRKSACIKLIMEDKDFHITKNNPSLYRLNWSFYYVFHSKKFNNMFFKKGKWKPIN